MVERAVGRHHRSRAREEGMVMTTDLGTRTTVSIGAPVQEVWAAITTPARIKEWFFGVDTRSDWTPGSELVHTGEWQGRPYEDKGTILRIEPPRLLVHTHWSAMSGRPDEPGNYEEVTWTLADGDDATELTVSETNLPSEAARDQSEQSWQMVLAKLKELLER
jgi:uncharacterized protein YndB with AHSA1/START domain